MTPPDLTGREARCGCGNVQPSSPLLPFFEFRGEGSPSAVEQCECGYFECAHGSGKADDIAKGLRPRRNVVEEGLCTGFRPRGDWGYDTFYCGCRGWD